VVYKVFLKYILINISAYSERFDTTLLPNRIVHFIAFYNTMLLTKSLDIVTCAKTILKENPNFSQKR